MNVFAFHPSNEFIGKFDIESIEELESAFEKFAIGIQVTEYDYLECDNRTWTVLQGSYGFSLQEGRLYRSSDPSKARQNSKALNELLKERYRTDRNASFAAIRFAGFIMVIGWLLGAAIGIRGIISAYARPFSRPIYFTEIFPWLILGALVALVLHFFSLLLATLARLLGSSLDMAINTSLHLSEDERTQAL